MSAPIQNRYDFVYFFEVTDGNPNGDPDAGNLPRVDGETNQGLVTDVCLKRKIRNYVAEKFGMKPPHDIYVREKAVLNEQHNRAYQATDQKPEPTKLPKDDQKASELTRWMCRNFFDIRAFGAVMTTEINCGQVRGPVQLTFARSIDPVIPAEFSITRCAVSNARDAEKERTMGRKFTVPYGLYRCHGFINPNLAECSGGFGGTGFSDDDLDLLKESLNMMFELDRSAARGAMAPVRCVAFKHDSKLGEARADELFTMVTAELHPEIKIEARPPRSSNDYIIRVAGPVPRGVEVQEWVRTRASAAGAS